MSLTPLLCNTGRKKNDVYSHKQLFFKSKVDYGSPSNHLGVWLFQRDVFRDLLGWSGLCYKVSVIVSYKMGSSTKVLLCGFCTLFYPSFISRVCSSVHRGTSPLFSILLRLQTREKQKTLRWLEYMNFDFYRGSLFRGFY